MKYLVFPLLLIGLLSCKSPEKKHSSINNLRKNVSAKITQSDTGDLRTDDTTINLEKIIFSGFDLKIKNFQVLCGVNGFNRTDYPDEHINYHNDKFVTITEKADTIVLSIEDLLDNKLVEIIPQDKGDVFRVSYCYNYRIQYEKGGGVYIEDKTTYKPIKDSASFFFRLPLFQSLQPTDEIKAKLRVTDSVVKTYTGDYGEGKYTAYIVKGKSVNIARTNICIKVERLKNNIIKKTKFMVFSDFDPD